MFSTSKATCAHSQAEARDDASAVVFDGVIERGERQMEARSRVVETHCILRHGVIHKQGQSGATDCTLAGRSLLPCIDCSRPRSFPDHLTKATVHVTKPLKRLCSGCLGFLSTPKTQRPGGASRGNKSATSLEVARLTGSTLRPISSLVLTGSFSGCDQPPGKDLPRNLAGDPQGSPCIHCSRSCAGCEPRHRDPPARS